MNVFKKGLTKHFPLNIIVVNMFIIENRRGFVRKKDDTLHDTLLEAARQIADTEGLEAVNIRSLAGKAGVATGTVYNYFTNKDGVLLALTEEYWKQTLLQLKALHLTGSFCDQLQEIFLFLKERIDQSAGKLMSSLGNVERAGQARMTSMQSTLEAAFIQRMEQDAGIRKDAWTETFTKEQFARFIMMNLMMMLKSEAPDLQFFITIIKRTIY